MRPESIDHRLLGLFIASALPYFVHGGTSVDRIRGIPLNRKALYDPGKDFACFDGSRTIPFDWVNDDYCDCADGSDEPGTAACPRSKFHCLNLGAAPLDVPSSRVNDMICDCCDGSDEWAGYVNCTNSCEDLGRRMKEELARRIELHADGYAARLEMVANAKTVKAGKEKRLQEVKKELSELAAPLEELKAKMDEAVRLETAAKDVEYKAWNEAREARRLAIRKGKAEVAFNELDVNKDGRVTVEEVQARMDFDQDSDGVVTVEEAKTVLGNATDSSRETFVNDIWHRIESSWKPELTFKEGTPTEGKSVPELLNKIEQPSDSAASDSQEPAKESTAEGEAETTTFTVEPSDDDSRSVDDDEDEDVQEEVGSVDETIVFSNETQTLIEAADQARERHLTLADKKLALDNEVKEINSLLSRDFGPDLSFLPLYKQCFEVNDSQYKYKLCMFDEAQQISLNDNHAVGLGRWGKWLDGETPLTRKQLYEHGQSCWNGPQRSTTVILECDKETRLKSAIEPSMCEYQLVMGTPAVCEPPETLHAQHIEL